MNDEAELHAADSIIIEVARNLWAASSDLRASVFDGFIKGYPNSHIAELKRICLACFSASRDDKGQWKKYGDSGMVFAWECKS
jgi:hypothetical protein